MKWFVIGLGNPGDEYKKTPHNVGREAVEYFIKKNGDAGAWKTQTQVKMQTQQVAIDSHTVVCVLPDTFMNKSGAAVQYFVKTAKDAERTIVLQDDLDLPLGTMKIVFNRGSGGHKGIESVVRAIKTEAFVRIRIGVSPVSAKGIAKKPKGEDAVVKFILKPLKDDSYKEIQKIYKKIAEAIPVLITEGRPIAMTQFN